MFYGFNLHCWFFLLYVGFSILLSSYILSFSGDKCGMWFNAAVLWLKTAVDY